MLTAAHCVFGKDWNNLKVVLGDYDVGKKERQELHVNICGIKVHSSYEFSGPTLDDIALLELCRNVRLTKAIQPIQLANKDLKVPAASSVTVAGWGAVKFRGGGARILRKVTLNTIQSETCQGIYSWMSDGELCAGNINLGGKDSCQGDSGGALWLEDNGTPYQVGIVSHGKGCASPGAPGVYTSITHYRDWIEKNMNNKLNPNILSLVPPGIVNEFGAFLFENNPVLLQKSNSTRKH